MIERWQNMEYTVDMPDLQNATIVNADEFGMNETSQDNTQALYKAINHCKRFKSSVLEINKGIYMFNNVKNRAVADLLACRSKGKYEYGRGE
jgi:hypothetical protein